MEVSDGVLRRAVWTVPLIVEAMGPAAARRAARVVAAIEGRTDAGVQRVATRISPRLAKSNPGLRKIDPRWSVRRIRVRRLGLRLELDLRDNLQAVLYYAGRYEPATMRFVRRELRRGDVFVDVGANIGLHSLYVARRLRRLGGGLVIAFEPAADCVARLRAAARRNGLAGLIEIGEVALGNESGEVELRADPRYSLADTGVRSIRGEGASVERVTVTRLDDWAVEHTLTRIDLMKIDIEGAELDALAGTEGTLRRLRPRAVLVEDKRPEERDALHQLMQSLGYTPYGRLDYNALFRPGDPQ